MNEKALKTIEFDKVLDLLKNYACSDLGKARCLQAAPLATPDEIKTALKITTQAQKVFSMSGNFLPIGSIPDIEPSYGKLKNKLTLAVEEIKNIYEIILNGRLVSSYLNRFSNDYTELLKYTEHLFCSSELEEKITTVFDVNFDVKDSASAELKSLFQSKRSLNENLKNTVNALLNNPSFSVNLQDNIYTTREGRIVFQVKAESKNKVNGIVHDVSASGQTYFIEPRQIVELNNRIREAQIAIDAEIQKIIKQLSIDIGEYFSQIKMSFETLIELDFIFAKAKYSTAIDACEPEVCDEKIISLNGMKNPVLMSVCDNVVENDFNIADPVHSVIITGSNAGGKTVVLKTVGLSIAMTEAGMHIPAFKAKIYPFKKLYAEIGDEQNIIQSLSTFSSHIKNIKNILDNADAETFIVIDEIAAGTDPKEGACLARAVMEKFNEQGAFSLISTHFSELKSLPFDNPNFQNASVDFDVENLQPTYKLRIGIPGSSNAFAIAKNLGIPESIIETANSEYTKDITQESKILTTLQQKYSELNKLTEETKSLKEEAQEKYNEYSKLLETLNTNKRKSLKDFKNRYESNVSKAKEEIKTILESLNKNKSRENALSAYKKVSKTGKHLNEMIAADTKELSTKYVELDEIKPGMNAIIKDLDQDVKILTPPDKNGNLQILIGQLKTHINVTKLAKSLKEKKSVIKKKYKLSKTQFEISRINLSNKLDLRGSRIDEALAELEAYLDKASLVNLTPVQIIHGHGSGQLRHAIREYLNDSPYVAKYRPGENTEGGDGVTVIDIN